MSCFDLVVLVVLAAGSWLAAHGLLLFFQRSQVRVMPPPLPPDWDGCQWPGLPALADKTAVEVIDMEPITTG